MFGSDIAWQQRSEWLETICKEEEDTALHGVRGTYLSNHSLSAPINCRRRQAKLCAGIGNATPTQL